jgi:hypothetical protein
LQRECCGATFYRHLLLRNAQRFREHFGGEIIDPKARPKCPVSKR